MDAPLVYGCVSRLVLDVNRDLSDLDSIVETADGALVPGNSGLSVGERERRVAEIYAPYHAAIEDLLAKRAQHARRSALVAIYTFTPSLQGVVRPWHCGVIFASDSRMGEALVKGLQEEDGLVVGVNRTLRAFGSGLPHDVEARRRLWDSGRNDRGAKRSSLER